MQKFGEEYFVEAMLFFEPTRAYIKDRLYIIPARVLCVHIIPGALGIMYTHNTQMTFFPAGIMYTHNTPLGIMCTHNTHRILKTGFKQ